MAFKLIFLILLIAGFSWCYNNINIADFTEENITQQIQKEKTINSVQKTREKRNKEVQQIMDRM